MRIIIREDGREKVHQHCGLTRELDLAEHLGVHRAQVGKVFSGKHHPGNRFIAGIVHRCGLKFAFDHVFDITEDDA